MSPLETRDLAFSYADDPSQNPFRLESVSFSLPPGGLLGVLGPNGSGKSTLLRLLCGLLSPQGGRIVLAGEDTAGWSAKKTAQRAALVPQEMSTLFPVTVEQFVALGRHPHSGLFGWGGDGGRVVENALADTDLLPLRHRLVSHLSGGERRRALLARALAQEPRILLLDEPTAHLDPRHQVELLRLIERGRREKGLAVVAVLHDVNLAAAWCPRLLILKNGRPVAEGKTEDIFSGALLETAYDVPAKVVQLPEAPQRFVDFFQNIP